MIVSQENVIENAQNSFQINQINVYVNTHTLKSVGPMRPTCQITGYFCSQNYQYNTVRIFWDTSADLPTRLLIVCEPFQGAVYNVAYKIYNA